MTALNTREEALGYLAQIFPSSQFDVYPFEMGWVCLPILTQQEIAAGMALGLTKLVIDAATGIVTEYPSWSIKMVADDYLDAKRSGNSPAGGQIYPPLWRITLRRTREDPETIDYQLTAVSLDEPAEPTREHALAIDKTTLCYEPTDTVSSVATSHAEWCSRQYLGRWPEHTMTEY